MRSLSALGVAVLLQMPQAILAQSSSSSSSSSNSGSTIVYVVIGVAALLVLLAGAFFWKRRQNKKKSMRSEPRTDIEVGVTPRRVPPELNVGAIGHGGNNRGNNRSNGNNNGGYDVHISPAVNGNNGNGGRPGGSSGKSRVPRPLPGPPGRSIGQTGGVGSSSTLELQPSFGSGPSAGSSSYTPSQGSSTGSSAREASDSSARSREVLALVLADLQNDPAVGRRKIAYSALYFTRVLSKGAFGEVWLAQLENRQVAVKRILNEKRNDEKEIVCFGAEIKLMAAFSHPKIVEFVGVSWSSSNDICAVTEYMAKGDLFGFLKRRNGQINWADHKIYLAEDVADALVYLHSLTPKVIHRDLKSKNILLDDDFRAKLSDFGISRERSLEETMTAGVGTIYWTAPEVLMGKKYTEKADIYSFGIVLSELDTHEVPYHDVRDEGRKLQAMKIVKKVISESLRPTFTTTIPPIVMDLARRCLDAEPNVRPDAIELLQIIQNIQHQL